MKSFTSLIILAFAAIAIAGPVPQIPGIPGVGGVGSVLPIVEGALPIVGDELSTLPVRRQLLDADILGSLLGGNRKRTSVPDVDLLTGIVVPSVGGERIPVVGGLAPSASVPDVTDTL